MGVTSTMMGAMKSAGLKPTDLYNPENQDKMALAFATSIGIDVNRLKAISTWEVEITQEFGNAILWKFSLRRK